MKLVGSGQWSVVDGRWSVKTGLGNKKRGPDGGSRRLFDYKISISFG
jgi:hypothetical protein